MAKRPGGDLGAMTLTKAQAADAVPFRPMNGAPQAVQAMGAQKSLTVKLDGATYAGLRAYCYAQEQARGTRLTHQQVMVEAVQAFLAAHGDA